jgi:hypothetical protein
MDRPFSNIPQRFVINHHEEAAFKTGGLRGYAAYRDLGAAAATKGKPEEPMVPPCLF